MNKKSVRFKSVSDMVRATSQDQELADEVAKEITDRHLVKLLIALRVQENMSQKDLAKKLGCTQSRVSKLENSRDSDLKLGPITVSRDRSA